MLYGSIEVVVGSMFSGKTEELIRRVKRAELARQKVQVFKPKIDNRYSIHEITSHSSQKIKATIIDSPQDILHLLNDSTRVVGVDEAQFFDPSIVDVVQKLANRGIRVICAGLDTDWRGRPFHPMPELMAVSESVTKQHAVCMVCGAQACRTQRTTNSSEDILIGALDAYEARCRNCFEGPDENGILNLKIHSSKIASLAKKELT